MGDAAKDGAQLRPHIVWFEEPVPMIQKAAALVSSADIFIVVGSSLVVYPAAGLVRFAAPSTPRFIVDKKIPYTDQVDHLVSIEKPATEGMTELAAILRSKYL